MTSSQMSTQMNLNMIHDISASRYKLGCLMAPNLYEHPEFECAGLIASVLLIDEHQEKIYVPAATLEQLYRLKMRTFKTILD